MTRRRRQARTARAQREFLAEFALCGNVLRAALTVNVGRQTVYNWRQDSAFAKLYDEAHEDALDRLEEEARRRAVDGVVEPVVSAGKVVTHVRNYSDALLMMLLRAKRPDTFGKRRDANATDTDQTTMSEKLSKMSNDELKAYLVEMMEKL